MLLSQHRLDPISIVNMNDWCQSSGMADVFAYWRILLLSIMNLAESNGALAMMSNTSLHV